MKAMNKVADIVRLGLQSLTVHKVRSIMSALGIIFGVWGVIATLAISEGASFQAQQMIRELGSDNIIVESVKPASEESKASAATGGVLVYGLTFADVDRLTASIPGIKRCVISHRTLKYGHAGDNNVSVSVIATEPGYSDVARIDMQAGRFISSADVLRRMPYCVITGSLARQLFDYEDPLNQIVRLSGEPFQVVGVLERLPRALAGEGSDVGNYVVIPFTADRQRFGEITFMNQQGSQIRERVQVSQIILQMESEAAVMDGSAIATSLLSRFHNGKDYSIKVPLDLIEQAKRGRRMFNIMILFIAMISLLVGGIGIMNILLASVTERTREIGIRRAMGAKRRDIVIQFLTEAIALTSAGGLIGIGMGMALPWVIEHYLDFKTIVTPATILLPFFLAILVGVVSGLYPAMRAAKLDPIIALRHE